jgi:hypothetical protein
MCGNPLDACRSGAQRYESAPLAIDFIAWLTNYQKYQEAARKTAQEEPWPG